MNWLSKAENDAFKRGYLNGENTYRVEFKWIISSRKFKILAQKKN